MFFTSGQQVCVHAQLHLHEQNARAPATQMEHARMHLPAAYASEDVHVHTCAYRLFPQYS